jgi:hypothetical protein
VGDQLRKDVPGSAGASLTERACWLIPAAPPQAS